MDTREYLELSERTLSPGFHKDLCHGNEVYQCLQALITLGSWADTIKRALYYGKPGQLRTAANHRAIDALQPSKDFLHGILGELTELAELAESYSKHAFDGAEFDRVNTIEELGDLYWYLACMLRFLGVTPEDDIYPANINKLAKRFKDRFTQEEVLNRDLTVERAQLERDVIEKR